MLIDQYKNIQQALLEKKNIKQATSGTVAVWETPVPQAKSPELPTPAPVVPVAPASPPVQPSIVEPISIPWTTIWAPTWDVNKAPVQTAKETSKQDLWTVISDPNLLKLERIKQNKLNSNLSIYSTGKSLYDWVQGGTILPWTQEFTDLTTRNPQVLQEYNLIKAEKAKADTVKTLGTAIVGEPVQTKPSNALEQLTSFFTKSMDTDVASEYQNSVINNPAYQASIQTMNGINQQIADNNKNINALREDVRKKYSAWTPESLIASAIAREARPLIEQWQYLAQLQENAQSEMTRLFEENKQVFDLKQDELTNNRNIALKLYETINAEEIRQEDIIREDDRIKKEIALEEYRYQRELADGNILRAEEYKQKLDDLRIQDEYNLKNWLLQLGVDPTGMTTEEMNKEYAKAVDEQTSRQTALDYAKITKVADNGDWTPAPQFEPVFNDDGTMKVSQSSVYNLAIWEDGNSVKVQWVEEGWYAPNGRVECWAFVNDIIGVKIFGNKLSDKTKNINSREPVVWWAFIEDVWPYGHVWFIESINEDGSINIIDSNYSKDTDGKIRRDTIAVWSPRWNQIKGFYDPTAWTIEQVDIGVWNSMTASERKKNQNNPQYKEFVYNYQRVMSDQNASIEEILRYSDWFPKLGDKEWERLQKFSTALNQIGDLQKEIWKSKTWPIVWIFRTANPYDTNAQTVKAELQALIPWLARGVYGEVGVLTDQDIENYRKTIPNLKSTKDVNDAILAMTMKTLASWYKQALQDFAGAKNDVSWLQGTYYRLIEKSGEIEKRLGISSTTGGSFQTTKTDKNQENSEIDSLRWGNATAQYSWDKWLTFS